MEPVKKDILNLSFDDLGLLLIRLGEPKYHARQLFQWLYRKSAETFTEMTDLPQKLIATLNENFFIGRLTCTKMLSADDGAEKFLFRLEDSHSIETVLLREKNRRTICLSSQVGCKFGCPFCVSGAKGFVRNLTVSEITGQVLGVQKLRSVKVTNLVMMGIGEPLDNYDQVTAALRTINHQDGMRLGARKITISTCGIVPGIRKLKDLGLQVELSVSLHAARDNLRDRLVPINRKYPLSKLLGVCRDYHKATGRIITFEYAVIENVNDSPDDARKLGELVRRQQGKVNLIPCNANLSEAFRGADERKLRDFAARVQGVGAKVTIRNTKGGGILAACGQLAFDRHQETRKQALDK